MKGRGLILTLALLLPTSAIAQMTRDAAQADATEFAKGARDLAVDKTLNDGAPEQVPGYEGTDLPQTSLADDPERLSAQGLYATGDNEAYHSIIDKDRPVFDPKTIDLSSASAIEKDPETYVGTALSADGTQSQCQPLPPGTGVGSEYLQICNSGLKPEQTTEVCRVPLVPQFSGSGAIKYTCGRQVFDVNNRGSWENGGEESSCTGFQGSAQCTLDSEVFSVDKAYLGRIGNGINLYRSESIRSYKCSAPTSSPNGGPLTNSFGSWTPAPVVEVGRERAFSGSIEDFSACPEPVRKGQCSLESSVCVDGDPTTRVVDGVSVTQSCWTKSNTYKCDALVSANDCGDLAANPKCKFDHEDCLDDPQEGECKVKNHYYRCTTDDQSQSSTAFICSGDLYCINGECQQIEREASTEFKDALVALNTLGAVRDQFDPENLSLFKGEAMGCHKPIFGLVNCCAGKQSGLLSTAAGAAALAGGPATIAAIATPFLTMFLCGAAEMQLDVKDRMGLCSYVGTYCSEKVLGVCTTRRSSYCCFESKLTRIIQSQGRAQLGMSFGDPKSPDCRGFTVEEFQHLDLSKMDFSDVYKDLIDAAKAPDEVESLNQIQQRIKDYYDTHSAK